MAAPETLRPGLDLGGFVLGDKLAVGGMAEIWAAHRAAEGPSAPVALKVLLPHFSGDPAFLAMFRDEVAIASRLRHQNIVSVFGVHEARGHLFQAMERIDGCDLRRLLSHLSRAGRRLPVPLALFVGQQLARALDYAHQRRGDDGRALDIVHRDVSPHNVMLGRDGQVKLLDFGVARATERTARTRTGVIKGKLAYMAPEQALAVGVTPQTDIFAAGVVLWEMLAQERLFTAPSEAELVDAVVRAEVPEVRDRNPEVPADVAALLDRMLQARALERPASMAEVERGLTKALVVHYEEADAGERVLSAWLAAHGPAGPPPTAALPAEDDTAPTPAPPTTDPTPVADPTPNGDATLTLAGPDASADATWHGPPPQIADVPEVDAHAATAARPPDVDVARTLVDDAFDARAVLGDTPTPGSGGATPREGGARLRRPTQAEINQAVDAIATVEVVADPQLRELAQSLQVSSVPTPEATSAPWKVASPQPGAPWSSGEAPASDASGPRDVPTVAGALVGETPLDPESLEPETLVPEPPAEPEPEPGPIAFRGTDSSDGFEPVGPRAPAVEPAARPLTPPPALPAVDRPRPKWAWVLPAITLVLAGVVLVLIFLLIRGQ